MTRQTHRIVTGLAQLEYLYKDINDIDMKLKAKLKQMPNFPKDQKDKLENELKQLLKPIRYLLRYGRSRYSEALEDDYLSKYELESGLKSVLNFVDLNIKELSKIKDEKLKLSKRVRLHSIRRIIELYINELEKGKYYRHL